MAPEIVQRRTQTTKVDIYSLGIVLYELLNGSLGLGETDSDLRQAIDKGIDYTELTDLGHEMIKRMISWEPADRPSAEECLRQYYGQDDSPATKDTGQEVRSITTKRWKVAKPQ